MIKNGEPTMLDKIKAFAKFITLIAMASSGSYAAGALVTQRGDMKEALANGAGFYDTRDGAFHFAQAPVLLDSPSEGIAVEGAAAAIPAQPKHRPKER